MAISRARRNFRRVLLGLLVLSFAFAGTMAYYRASFKRTASIAPYLFQIDIAQMQARAYFAGNDDKFDIAAKMYQNQFFSRTYSAPAHAMIDDLVADDHAPAMTLKAHYLIRLPHRSAQDQAINLFHGAAAQSHQPALDAIDALGLAQVDIKH